MEFVNNIIEQNNIKIKALELENELLSKRDEVALMKLQKLMYFEYFNKRKIRMGKPKQHEHEYNMKLKETFINKLNAFNKEFNLVEDKDISYIMGNKIT